VTWSPVGPSGIAGWAYLGFTDATHGVGLGYVGSLAAGNEQPYYTTDGGASYHLVSLPRPVRRGGGRTFIRCGQPGARTSAA
jgi:hypothetical protein